MATGTMTSMATGMGMAAPTGMTTPMPGTTPGMGPMMVPHCTITMEKCQGGMRIVCSCEDKMSAAMIQNLCMMMAGGMCSCCMTMNGMMVCCCNLTMGMCRCENTKDGVVLTCTTGDKDCCAMIQACCDCMTAMMQAHCTCCIMMNNMPLCCG